MSYQLSHDKYLTETEEKFLRARLEGEDEPLRLYFEVLLATGCRPSEALDLHSFDLVDDTHSVKITGLKDSLDREIGLEPNLFARLKAHAKAQPSSRLFTTGIRNYRAHWHRIRPVKKKLHGLRHTFAVRLYLKTKDIKLVQYALGHKNIQNTMIYTELDQSERLRSALVG